MDNFVELIDVDEFQDKWWVVFFGCNEVVLRLADTAQEASYPDDLDCEVERVEPLRNYEVKDIWIKNNQIRAKVIKLLS